MLKVGEPFAMFLPHYILCESESRQTTFLFLFVLFALSVSRFSVFVICLCLCFPLHFQMEVHKAFLNEASVSFIYKTDRKDPEKEKGIGCEH